MFPKEVYDLAFHADALEQFLLAIESHHTAKEGEPFIDHGAYLYLSFGALKYQRLGQNLMQGLSLYYKDTDNNNISQFLVINLKSRWKDFLVDKDFVDAVVTSNTIRYQEILCKFIVKFCQAVPNKPEI